MECWTWGDVVVYFVCTTIAAGWQLSPLGILVMLLKFPYFLFLELPVSVLLEFKLVAFERRSAERNFSTFFEYSAMLFVRWVLRTFNGDLIRNVFFSDLHARALFQYRRFKYGTDNIGDFDYKPNSNHGRDEHGTKTPPGYWVYSTSRRHQKPDLVIYFVPGNLIGCASPYVYLEFLSMMLVELQVQGFRYPMVFCADVNFQHYKSQSYAFAAIISEVAEGWRHVQNKWPHAKTLCMGTGVGATLLLSLLLQIARPCIDVPIQLPSETSVTEQLSDVTDSGNVSESRATVTSRGSASSKGHTSLSSIRTGPEDSKPIGSGLQKPDALLLVSPISRVAMPRKDNSGDFITSAAIGKAFRRLMEDESDCLWTMPGRVRDSSWWSQALPTNGTVIMHGGLETLLREEEQLIQTLRDMNDPRIVSDCRLNEVHAWPITRAFLARTATDQLDGISRVADHIAKLLVMDCLFANGSIVD